LGISVSLGDSQLSVVIEITVHHHPSFIASLCRRAVSAFKGQPVLLQHDVNHDFRSH
jgi:hypothetical protein